MSTTIGVSGLQFIEDVSLTPSAVDPNSVSRQTFTVKGLQPEMMVFVKASALETGLFLIYEECSASNTLKLCFWNTTNATITPVAQNFKVIGL